MPGKFADSNVLLYLTSTDPALADAVERLIEDGLVVSVQVLNEVTNVALRKFRRTWPEVDGWLDRLVPLLAVHPLTEAMHRDARRLAQRYRLQWWDALIVAAALETGCDVLYSQDMHAGLLVEGRLRVVNPFA